MMNQAAEQRQQPRIATVPRAGPDHTPDHPLLVNVSADGACLWLEEPPPIERYLVLRFRCKGEDRVLRSRIVWSSPCEPTPKRNNPPGTKGWLTGITFDHADTGIRIDAIPHDILHAGQATVSFEDHDDVPLTQQLELGTEQRSSELTVVDEWAILALTSATKDLVPILANNSSDIRLVCTRDHLELSASLRPHSGQQAPQIRQPAKRAIETRQQPSTGTSPDVNLPSNMAAPSTDPAGIWPGREFIVLVGVAALILGAFYFSVLRDSGESAEAAVPIVGLQLTPTWSQGLSLNSEVLEGWVEVKQTFDLPDKTVRSMILIMQDNEKYPSGHDLHDLSKHPVQVRRALSLLAAAKAESATPLDIGMIKDDLESHLMAGARFPDEPPGGRYSSLQRELYHNLVVLGVVDLLHRQKDATPVREILAALPHSELKQKTK